MARPTKLTPETQKAIVDALSIGATRKSAVLAAGISYKTFLNWLDIGRMVRDGELRKTKTRNQFLQFLQSVEKSEHEAFVNYTKTIASAAAKGDWRAAESFLKRRDPDNWGDRQKTDITSGGEKIDAIVKVGINPDKI
jgi:hypothetical protein